MFGITLGIIIQISIELKPIGALCQIEDSIKYVAGE